MRAAIVTPGSTATVMSSTSGGVTDAELAPGQPGLVEAWGRVSWLHCLTAGVAILLVLEFVHPLALRAPELRETMETIVALLALTASGLLGAHFGHTKRLRNLLLLGAMLMLAFGAAIRALPLALHLRYGYAFAAALPLSHLFVAITLAAAAFTPPNRLIAGDARRPLLIAAFSSLAAFAAAELGGIAFRGHLLTGPSYSGPGLERALHHPFGFGVLVLSLLFLAYAAIDFARRARGERDGVLSLYSGAAVLLLAAQAWYLALPRLAPDLLTLQDALGLLVVGLVLAAAVRKDLEIRGALTRAATLAERRRVAQDLHDGLAQDLAFIAAHGVRMAQELGDEHPLALAAKRALAVSRETISDLSDLSSTAPGDALEAVAHELQERFGIEIAVYAQPDAALPPEATDHVARIAREAIANAARHGQAQNIVVSLTQTTQGAALRVCDDGCGIPRGEGERAPEGFGLRSMHERAVALGGHLSVRERRTGGTELEVVLP
jgi:signal transduction histidine kinase